MRFVHIPSAPQPPFGHIRNSSTGIIHLLVKCPDPVPASVLVARMVAAGASVKWVQGSVGYHLDHAFREYHLRTFAEAK